MKRQRVGAYTVCVDEFDRILLCRIAPGYTAGFAGYWTLPGGGLEHGEDPRAAALRELEEETGLQGKLVELLDVESNHSTFTTRRGMTVDFHGIRIIYRAVVAAGTLRTEANGSTDACGWFTREEVRELPALDLVRHVERLVWGGGAA
jgi:ADP-ribose pyrophosphatase YjhB (NUDIX family)